MISLIEIFRILRKGNTPKEIDWKNIFSSVWHKTEKLPIEQIMGLAEEINRVTTNFKGYHTTLDGLLAAHPQNKNRKDFYAWVGSPYPGTVYVVKENGGSWINTGEAPTQQQIDLTEYAKIKDVKGNQVVYAKNGVLSSQNVSHHKNDVEEILDGIGYQFKIDDTHETANLFTAGVASHPGRRHSDESGLGQVGYPEYSITTPFRFAPQKGDVLLINTNQTIVFYTDNLNVVHSFIPSTSGIPKLEAREIIIEQEGIKNIGFTFLTELGRENIYVKHRTFEKQTAGVPVENVVLENGSTLSEFISNSPKYKKGLPFKEKKKLEFTEIAGYVGLAGNIGTSNTGIIARCTELLEANSVYYVEIDEIITGFICATVGGYPLVIAGRNKFFFKTDEREDQEFAMWVKADQQVSFIPVLFDVRGKYKAYKLEQPLEVKGVPALPAVANDLSAFPSAKIPEPKFVIWNVIGNYHTNTSTTEYGEEPVQVEYLDSNGNYFKKFAVMGGQGRSSMTFENHNSKFKLMNRDGSKFVLTIGDLLPRSTFHFKVNFSDFAQLNNPATAAFFTDWYRDESDPKFRYPWLDAFPVDLSKVQLRRTFDKRPRGIIAAIPTSICTLWNHRSCGTMNLNAFAENFFLDANNPLHRGFRGDLDDRNKDRWEEMCSDTEGMEMTDETWKPFADWYGWIRANASSTKVLEFRSGDGVKFDSQNLIDTWLIAEWFFLSDNLQANQVWISYDSEKFTYMWYDMDSAFGHLFNGKVEFKPTDEYKPNRQNVAIWEQVKRAYAVELKERYAELRRNGRFSIEKVREVYGSFHSRFDYEWFEKDFYTYRTRNSIKEGSFASLNRVYWFVEERLKFLDSLYGYS